MDFFVKKHGKKDPFLLKMHLSLSAFTNTVLTMLGSMNLSKERVQMGKAFFYFLSLLYGKAGVVMRVLKYPLRKEKGSERDLLKNKSLGLIATYSSVQQKRPLLFSWLKKAN